MQERLKIQSQLQKMREECLRDYLSSKLEAIASKEVVNDILTGFLQANNQQFLQTITESIFEAKESNKRLKEIIETMKRDHEALIIGEREKIKEECKQRHYLQMTQLKEEVNLIKINLQEEGKTSFNKIDVLKRELEAEKQRNHQLMNSLDSKRQQIVQMTSKILTLQATIKDMSHKLSQSSSKIDKVKAEIVQKQRNFETQIALMKNMHLRKQSQLQAQLKKQNQSQIDYQKHHYEQRLRQMQRKLKNINQEMNNIKSELIKANAQKQKEQISKQEAISKNQLLRQYLSKAQQSLEAKAKENDSLQQLLANQKQENVSLLHKMQSLQIKHIDASQRQSMIIATLKDTVTKLEIQNNKLLLTKIALQQKIQKKNTDFYDAVQNNSEQISVLNKKIQQKQSQKRFLQQKLSSEIEANIANQEEIKNLLKYNTIQQQETYKFEREIRRIEEECRAQITTYQQAFRLNMSALEEELATSKEENVYLQAQIHDMSKHLQLEHEYQKTYHAYLQEIALLKKELSKYDSAHQSAQKNQKKYNLLSQLRKRFKQLSNENRKLREIIENQLLNFEEELRLSFKLLITEVQSHLIKCLPCQHEKQMAKKIKSPNKQRFLMDKTMPRVGTDKLTTTSMKRNLKSIQDRYQIMHSQNQSFTNRIDSYLNSN